MKQISFFSCAVSEMVPKVAALGIIVRVTVRLIRCMVRLSHVNIMLFSVCQHIFSQQDMRGTCDRMKKGAMLHTFNLENSVLCMSVCASRCTFPNM